ncbi:glycosyltransferase family 2 protein [Desulfohalovibrio reitneri]|uniref:glycosyltransferase family 2 protein n=1 Tax=Desulfohalovibrio reitneri TaxID=1307759 RepID=UPI0006900AEE|nr:glycosyltransferase [Desulfohalovibrio reitneri]
MQQTLSTVLRRHRLFGYPDPSWYIWGAGQIIQRVSETSQRGGMERERYQALHTAIHLLRQGGVFSPFDRDLFNMLFQLQGLVGLPDEKVAWHRWAFDQVRGLEMDSQGEAVVRVDEARGDPAKVAAALDREPPMHERYLLLLELWRLGERPEFLRRARRFMALEGTAPAGPALALAAWRAGEDDLARELAGASPATFLHHLLEGERSRRAGDLETARGYWRLSLKMEPLQPTLVYKIADSLAPPPEKGLVERADVHVAYYTFNKLDMTLDTLRSLLASNIGPATVSLLNNGSTAFSRGELEAGVEAVAQGREVNLVHLPTNIGAPAARNWLRNLPETHAADYLAYLDDDVLLPRDWLAHYLQDLKEDSRAVCAGPLCLNPGSIPTIQYVWRFFDEIGDQKIRFSNNCPQYMDFGQYDARRPALSVMGCCHLFDMRRVNGLDLPGFDIRFSPSQVDDLEHDMQIWKAGGTVVYDGRVRVVHRQDAGRQAPMTRASLGNVLSNHRKMEAKWSLEDLTRVEARVREADDAHYRRCLDIASPLLPQNVRDWLAAYDLPEPRS